MPKDKRDERRASDQDRLDEQAYLAEVMRRTGVASEAKARKLVDRLREEGDFVDSEGTWTTNADGFPVCIRESKG